PCPPPMAATARTPPPAAAGPQERRSNGDCAFKPPARVGSRPLEQRVGPRHSSVIERGETYASPMCSVNKHHRRDCVLLLRDPLVWNGDLARSGLAVSALCDGSPGT